MKNLIIWIGVTTMISLSACGQSGTNVPTQVKNAFHQKFPDASRVKWDQENDSEWEAEFRINGTEYSANFDNSGTWKETEYEIKLSSLPGPVKKSLDQSFGGYTTEVAEISETVSGKAYEFELKKGEEELEVSMDAKGTILHKEMSEEDSEDSD